MKKSEFVFKDVNHLGLPVIDISSSKVIDLDWTERQQDKIEDSFQWYMLDLVNGDGHSPRRYVHITKQIIEDYKFPKYVKEILTIIHDKYGDIVLGVVY